MARAPPGAVAALACLGLARCYDMYPCQEKATFSNMSCPAGTAVACWSIVPGVEWLCWSSALVPQWLFGPNPGTPGDVNCKAYPAPPGSSVAFYDGVCTFEKPGEAAIQQLKPPGTTWEEARRRAKRVLARMKESEKHSLLKGIGWYWPPWNGWWELQKWWYVGNTAAITRLRIPSLNMQDSAGGFRPYWEEMVGTVTCWPSQLSLAATWDPNLARSFAMALGAEFAGKGANVVLGPSVNVHRVGRGGRNFEYISGEDPYLGARLVKPWVEGMQSQGVMAVMKHWVFNEQETNRDYEDSLVDAKTSWELYYPPFQAAVDAGVSAAMCSYNKENGQHSCSNGEQLGILKKKMNFQGFVQSDWWALWHNGLQNGTDQDMPGIADHGIGMTKTCMPPGCKNASLAWYMPSVLASQPSKSIDEAALRILAAIFRLRIKSKCSPPHCEQWLKQNVTRPAHVALARHIAAESIVLLKNDGGLLPLPGKGQEKISSIAIVGEAAVAKPYDPAGLGQGQGVWNQGDYYSGGGSGHIAMLPGQVVNPLDGIAKRAKLAKLRVIPAPTNNTNEVLIAAQQADLTIIVAATTGQEAKDRDSLHLDGDVDSLIIEVAKVTRRIVVLMQVPGQVLTPWRDSVQAILAMFLGGQTTGDAWADVLFGDRAPSGRLPVMMPAGEADSIDVSTNMAIPYSEGLKTSYRNKDFKAAFPFGHGLTYTTFGYSKGQKMPCKGGAAGDLCLNVTIRNEGKVAAKTVPQVYLEFPPEAGHPAPFLKGFQKTPVILPGESQEMVFHLTDQELRYYDPHLEKWARPASVTALIGESAKDIRASVPLVVSGGSSGWTFWIVLALLLTLGAVVLISLAVRHARRRSARDEGMLSGQCGEDTSDDDSYSSSNDSSAA